MGESALLPLSEIRPISGRPQVGGRPVGVGGYSARGGGGHSGTKWLPTAKQPRGAEVVNAKIWGRSTHLKANKGGGQLPTKNQIGVVTCKVCFFQLYFVNYMIFIT